MKPGDKVFGIDVNGLPVAGLVEGKCSTATGEHLVQISPCACGPVWVPAERVFAAELPNVVPLPAPEPVPTPVTPVAIGTTGGSPGNESTTPATT